MISACVCTHNPDPDTLRNCLLGLRALDRPDEALELIVIDNSSTSPLSASGLGLDDFPYPARVVREGRLGLSHARVRGLEEARGEVILFVDDDNFLDPGYAVAVSRLFASRARIGAAGGHSRPRFAEAPPSWIGAVSGLALRDLGPPARCISGEHGASLAGAGLALRTAAMRAATQTPLLLEDRKGSRLTSGGDTELLVRIASLGWETWYDPELRLQHYIPAKRLQREYLRRLHFGYGVAMVWIDLYSGYPPSPAPVWFLRRAWYHRRLAWSDRRSGTKASSEDERVRIELREASNRGRASGLARLAFARHWPALVAPYLPGNRHVA
jgi:glycosyltransferase involved in cell wall biosynthesis